MAARIGPAKSVTQSGGGVAVAVGLGMLVGVMVEVGVKLGVDVCVDAAVRLGVAVGEGGFKSPPRVLTA